MSLESALKAAAYGTFTDDYGVTWRFRRIRSSALMQIGVSALAMIPGADPAEDRKRGRKASDDGALPEPKQVADAIRYREEMVAAAVVGWREPGEDWLAAQAETVAAQRAALAAKVALDVARAAVQALTDARAAEVAKAEAEGVAPPDDVGAEARARAEAELGPLTEAMTQAFAVADAKIAALREVEAKPRPATEFEAVRLTLKPDEAATAGVYWVGDLLPGVLVPLFTAVMAHFTDGGAAAERIRSFRT